MSEVQIQKAEDGFRWLLVEEGGELHLCHRGFPSRLEALQNLFIHHIMMGTFVGALARGVEGYATLFTGVRLEQEDVEFFWTITGEDGTLIGKSCGQFETMGSAYDNLIVVYTLLTIFVASAAQERVSEKELFEAEQ